MDKPLFKDYLDEGLTIVEMFQALHEYQRDYERWEEHERERKQFNQNN